MGDHDLFVAAILCAVPTFYFALEHGTRWRGFGVLPPLLWIYATPLALRGVGILPEHAAIYTGIKTYLLPFFVIMLVMTIDLRGAVRAVGRALPLMLIGTLGVIVGAPIGYAAVARWLDPMAWSGYGALTGSWIGGTANLAAVGIALGTPPDQLGLAILTDQAVFLAWLPMLITSRIFAPRFARWTGARPLDGIDDIAVATRLDLPPKLDFLLTLAIGVAAVWGSISLSARLPVLPPFLNASTWLILIVTTAAIALSFTPLRGLRHAETAGGALLYVFVATMGASASIAGIDKAPVFILGGALIALIHGAFVVIGAKLIRLDIHIAAIASAANLGGIASAPVVAAAHRRSLVPAALLLAMIGNVIGNYGAILAGHLCRMVAPVG